MRLLPLFALSGVSSSAHVDVEIKPGLLRQYSLCHPASGAGGYLIAVLRESAGRGGSAAMHSVEVGQTLQISSPRNHFPLHEGAARSLLFAGGIGVTPILTMAEHLARVGADFGVHYCARSPDRMAFKARFEASPFQGRVQCHFDDGPERQRLNIVAALSGEADGTHIYVCGPGGFIEMVLAASDARGYRDGQVHREYFAALPQAEASAEAFRIKLASSGRVLEVPADKSVLDVLRADGIAVPASCEQGVCGACVTGVLEGIPDHRDLCLLESEHAANNQFTPCCSRSKTPVLMIDL